MNCPAYHQPATPRELTKQPRLGQHRLRLPPRPDDAHAGPASPRTFVGASMLLFSDPARSGFSWGHSSGKPRRGGQHKAEPATRTHLRLHRARRVHHRLCRGARVRHLADPSLRVYTKAAILHGNLITNCPDMQPNDIDGIFRAAWPGTSHDRWHRANCGRGADREPDGSWSQAHR